MSKNRGEKNGIGVYPDSEMWVNMPKQKEKESQGSFLAGFATGASLVFIMALLIF